MTQQEQDKAFAASVARQAAKIRRPARRGGLLKLKPERVQEELKTMPGWSLAADGRALEHGRQFLQPAGAAKFAVYVADLAAVEGQPVHLGILGNRVLLTLPRRPNTDGLTMDVIDFARQLG
jgi:pterin-4a-carbinolamine dehydratase